MKFKKFILCLLASFSCLLLSACAFHTRSSADFPPQLHNLYLETPNSYSNFRSQLSHTLKALDFDLMTDKTKAHYYLEIRNLSFTNDTPPLTDLSQAIAINYILGLDMELKSSKGTVLVPTTHLSTSRIILLNSQQIYTSYSGEFVKPQLERILISQILDRLSNQQTLAKLEKP